MTLLSEYLETKRITQSMIVKETGITASSISAVVNPKTDFTEQNNIKTIRAIAKIQGITPGDVLNELINIDQSVNAFNEDKQFNLLITIWGKNDSIDSDEVYNYESLDEACDAFRELVTSNRVPEKISYDLMMTIDGDDSILLSATLEDRELTDNYTDNLDQLPDVLKSNVLKVKKQVVNAITKD